MTACQAVGGRHFTFVVGGCFEDVVSLGNFHFEKEKRKLRQVQLLALGKGPLTSKLARASPSSWGLHLS
eukprot:1153199-Pelagomonas_calceolata.AAC.1